LKRKRSRSMKTNDSTRDPRSAEFREFCWKSKEVQIDRDWLRGKFEREKTGLSEGVLTLLDFESEIALMNIQTLSLSSGRGSSRRRLKDGIDVEDYRRKSWIPIQ
jgi:hypothetical protein